MVGTVETNTDVRKLEGYEEVLQRFVKTLPLEQRLAGLAPEEILAALTPEQIVLGLPDAALQTLSAEYLATLSESARATIRQRLGR